MPTQKTYIATCDFSIAGQSYLKGEAVPHGPPLVNLLAVAPECVEVSTPSRKAKTATKEANNG